jgi:predicted dienelactone hydrolase
VVASLDHVDNTIYEQLAGTIALPLGDEVERRFTDLTRLLDTLLDPNATLVPEGLRGKLDAQRVGIVGHSIGSITSGRFSAAEPRVRASVFMAAPPTFPLLSSAELRDFKAPALFLRASEDNSIPIEMNDQILTDYRDFPQPAWAATLTDAGHFAFTDLSGIIPELSPGCGEAMRQTDTRAKFTYLDPKLVREIASTYAGAFFERVLLKGAGEALDAAPNARVMFQHHE